MELRHLRYFSAVAEELNFHRAAGRLGIAQPALSQQIRQLENELGVVLLDRDRRQVRLTPAGAAFLEKAQNTLTSAAEAIRTAQLADRGEIGRISIGFVTSALYGVGPDVIRLFRQRHPAVHTDLHELSVVQQADALRNRRIDVSFLRTPFEVEGLAVRTILNERWVIALPSAHHLSRRPFVPLAALAGDPFLLFPRNLAPSLYDHVLLICESAGFTPHIALEAQMQTIVNLVAANIGVALVPESLRNLRRKGLVYRSLAEPAPDVGLAVAWREGDRSPTLRAFLAVVDEAAAQFVRTAH
jgi:DNA-binding transcriptional LysR family regulator